MSIARSYNHAARSGTSTGFDPTGLPEPLAYYESIGLVLKGKGEWRTTACDFHGGSDSMRINTRSGSFVCMAGCGARGGDILAYEMAKNGLGFVEAAKALGAWVGPSERVHRKPTPISGRDALQVVATEATIVDVVAADLARRVGLKFDEQSRQLKAVGCGSTTIEHRCLLVSLTNAQTAASWCENFGGHARRLMVWWRPQRSDIAGLGV